MSTPARRPPNRLSRREREARAYRLTLATAATGLATFVVLILTIAGVTSFGLFLLLAVITAVLGWATRRSVT
jgi:hypothetical protein